MKLKYIFALLMMIMLVAPLASAAWYDYLNPLNYFAEDDINFEGAWIEISEEDVGNYDNVVTENGTLLAYTEQNLKLSTPFEDNVADLSLTTQGYYILNSKPNKDINIAGRDLLLHTFQISGHGSYDNIIKNLEAIDMRTGEVLERDLKIKINNPYTEIIEWEQGYGCTLVGEDYSCEGYETLSQEVDRDNWTEIERIDIAEGDIVQIGIFGNVFRYDYYDVAFEYGDINVEEYFASIYETYNATWHYTMDEASGTLFDSTTNNYDLNSVSGLTYQQAGWVNYSVLYNANNDYSYSVSAPQTTGTYTFSFWARRAGTLWNAFSGVASNGDFGANEGYGVWSNESGCLDYHHGTDIDHYGTNGTACTPLNEWVFATATFDGSRWCMFFNGTVEKCITVGALSANSVDEVNIGNRQGQIQAWNGRLDEVMYLNYSLTESQVLTLFNDYAGGAVDNPPNVTNYIPVNDTTYTAIEIEVNFTCYGEDDLNLENVSLILDGAIDQTNTSGQNATNYTFSKSLGVGSYNWTCRATDNSSQTAEDETFIFDIKNLNHTLLNPTDNYISDIQYILFNYTVSNYTIGVTNTSLLIDGIINQSNTSYSDGYYQFNVTGIPIGSHNWSVETYDNDGDRYESEVRDFAVANLDIILVEPDDNLNTNQSTLDFGVNVTGDSVTIDNVSLVLDGVINQTNTSGINGNYTFTVDGIFYGDHTWKIRVYDDNNNMYDSSERSFHRYNVSVNLVSPADMGTVLLTDNYTCNASSTSPGLAIQNISFYSNSSGVWAINQTYTNPGSTQTLENTFTHTINDTIMWSCSACDNESNCWEAGENRTVAVDIIAPKINITSPLENYDFLRDGDLLDLNWTIDEDNPDSCWFEYQDANETQYINGTITNLFDNNLSTFVSGAEGYFEYNGSSLTISKSLIDQSIPGYIFNNENETIDVSSCTDSTFYYNASNIAVIGCSMQTNISCGSQLIYSQTEACLSDPSWYLVEIKSSNRTDVPCDQNFTNFTYRQGFNSLTFFANDTAGNENSTTRSWTVDVIESGISYVNSVYETEGELIIYDIIVENLTSVSGILNYGGVEYETSSNSTGDNISIFALIDVPLVDVVENFTFFFDITVTKDTEEINLTSASFNQTASDITLGQCNATLTEAFVNYSTRSATTPYPFLDTTFSSAWTYHHSSGTGNVFNNFSFINITEDGSNYSFCGEPSNITYTVNNTIEVDATGFAKAYYFFQNTNLTNESNWINIYLLNDSLATDTVLTVNDRNQLPLSDVITNIQYYDALSDSYITLSQAKSSSIGSDVVALNWLDSFYKFVLVSDGETIYQTLPEKIYETPRIFVVTEDITYSFTKFENFDYSLIFNNVTNNFILTFTKPSGLVEEGCLRVTKQGFGGETQICDRCASSTSATLFCNIDGYGNGTYIATFYATGSLQGIDWLITNIGSDFSKTIFDAIGLDNSIFYAFALAILVTTLMFVSPLLAIVGMLLSIYLSSLLGFLVLDYVAFAGIVIAGGLIAWLISRK